MNNQSMHHPIAQKLGIPFALAQDQDLYFYPDPDKPTHIEVARVTLIGDQLEFSIKDEARIFSAKFDRAGDIISMHCSTGLPRGSTDEIGAMFCEEARVALADLVLPH